MKTYYVYILLCSDNSYYVGVTNNLEKRLLEHNLGINNSYTSTRLPVQIVYSAYFHDINEAIRWEKQIKGWSRKKKKALINDDWDEIIKLSRNNMLRQAQHDN